MKNIKQILLIALLLINFNANINNIFATDAKIEEKVNAIKDKAAQTGASSIKDKDFKDIVSDDASLDAAIKDETSESEKEKDDIEIDTLSDAKSTVDKDGEE